MPLAEFPSRFAYRRVDELPGHAGGPALHHFPDPSGQGSGDGPMVLFEPPGGPAWIGVFRAGTLASKAYSGLHGHPDPDRLCVVARGEAYVVQAGAPGTAAVLSLRPVFQVVPVVAAGLLLLVDPWQIAALDAQGERWRSERLAIDGLKILEVRRGLIRVVASGLEEPETLELAVETGEVR